MGNLELCACRAMGHNTYHRSAVKSEMKWSDFQQLELPRYARAPAHQNWAKSSWLKLISTAACTFCACSIVNYCRESVSFLKKLMAGVSALYTWEYDDSTPWYMCPNREYIEPLDVLQCLFPNKGRKIVASRTCFVPQRFSSQLLQNLLPSSTKYYTPEDFIDGIISLAVMSITISVMMLFIKEAWNCVDEKFMSINPSHKKLYVVANLSKAILLGTLALSPRYWVGALEFLYDNFYGIEVKRCGIIYIATDFVALFLVPKLPRSTLIHHIITSIMAVLVTSMNIQMPGWDGLLGVAKMGILYGLFSSLAFPVNAYLALRVVYPKARWMPVLIYICLFTYILCCTLNWGVHLLWLCKLVYQWEISVVSLLYLIAVYFMVSDDIILIKWLIRRGSPVTKDGK